MDIKNILQDVLQDGEFWRWMAVMAAQYELCNITEQHTEKQTR